MAAEQHTKNDAGQDDLSDAELSRQVDLAAKRLLALRWATATQEHLELAVELITKSERFQRDMGAEGAPDR